MRRNKKLMLTDHPDVPHALLGRLNPSNGGLGSRPENASTLSMTHFLGVFTGR